VMAGRVIPAFTMNAVPGLKLLPQPRLERVVIPLTALGLACWVFAPTGLLPALPLGLAALAHTRRLWGWQPARTRGRPILWILHAAYAWIPLGLALLALAQAGLIAASPGVHALAVGATGGLVIGMITRTARGHTGRPLRADRWEVACYAMVLAAALVRVFVPMLAPALTLHAVLCSAALWSAAFGLYAVRYWPVLTRPRLDGLPG